MDRYDAGIDFSGLEDARAFLWQKQLHLFEVPFYYIEYGIAQLGALQVWAAYKKDPQKALDQLFRQKPSAVAGRFQNCLRLQAFVLTFSPSTMEPLIQHGG
jgi:oligoendopeptidase F